MENKSYNYIKHFIDCQVRELNRPIELTAALKETLTDENINVKQFQIILMRINLLIKRHNANMFSSRVIHQLIGQIIKCESYKVELVSKRLNTVSKVIRPLILPSIHQMNYNNADHLKEFQILVDELPEGKYLFVANTDARGSGSSVQAAITSRRGSAERRDTNEQNGIRAANSPASGLIEDFEDRVVEAEPDDDVRSQFVQSVNRQVDEASKVDEELVSRYEVSRTNLIKVNKRLQYKYKKLQYLKELRGRLISSLGLKEKDGQLDVSEASVADVKDSHLYPEVDKFRMLVNSIKFKVNDKNKDKVVEAVKNL